MSYENYAPFSRSEDLNLFSFWFPKVEKCGILVPKSIVIPVPEDIQRNFYMDHIDEDYEAVRKWVQHNVMPAVKEAGLDGMLFIKNGQFSNKFDANASCLPPPVPDITANIINVMYNAMCMGAEGCSELVVRQRIPYDRQTVPTIYNGLPLRPEFRVFYDFTEKKVIFCADYWDFDYVAPHLYDLTDRVIFTLHKEDMKAAYEAHKQEAMDLVAEHMAGVNGLEGPWSVDLMLANGKFWLIDMATAERSAYWEKRPCEEKKSNEKEGEKHE